MWPWPAIWRAKRATGPVTGGLGQLEGWGGGGEGKRALVDFAEDDDAGELGLGKAGDDGVVEVYA